MQFSEALELALGLIGGLSLFLFGMNLMGEALEKSAGSRLTSILRNLTASPIRGFLLGMCVTAIIQSSSATTVMLVGFVNSGLMTLGSAIPIIMGANLGTTVTSWLLSLTRIEGDHILVQMLKPSSFTPLLALVGVILYLFINNSKKRNVGIILLGFSVLIFGMELMSDSVSPLKEVPEFAQILLMFQNPVLGILMGAVITGIIQSSSASIGILQALSSTGAVSFGTAIPIIMGQNIGTCITALISSVGANKNAKRVAAVHLSFNVLGCCVICAVFYSLNAIIGFTFTDLPIDEVGIATVHTAFNLICTLLLLPFAGALERLVRLIVKDGADTKSERVLLEQRLIATPSVAIMHAGEAAQRMAKLAHSALCRAIDMLDNYSKDSFDSVVADEELVDLYEDRLGTYLMEIAGKDISHSDSLEVTKLLHVIGDLERISDHAVNLAESAKEMHDKGIFFSTEAKSELNLITSAIREILELTDSAFCDKSTESALKVEPLEEVVDTVIDGIKVNHINRLKKGECTIELGFILSDILTNLERISDHCSNVAGCMLEILNNSLGMHSYYKSIKAGNETYDKHLEYYSRKYILLPLLK